MSRSRFPASVSTLALLLALAAPAAAQPTAAQPTAAQARSSGPDSPGPAGADDREIEEIVVTAQLRAQPLQDVPMPINAFTGSFLRDVRIDDFEGLADLAPGLEVLEQTVQNPTIVVRGVSSGGSAANIENRISVFQDGISISRAQGALQELFDVGQVEVLKGPQGTLYGRGSTAGAIAVASARPDFDGTYGSVSAGIEEFDGWTAGAMLNVPVNDRAALRVAATRHYRDGFIKNLENGEPTGGTDMTAGRISGTVRLSDAVEATLILNGQRDRGNSNVFKAVTIPTRGGGFSGSGDNTPWNRLPFRTDPFSPMQSDLGDASYLRRDVAGATLLVDAQLGDITLSSISGYRYLKSDDYFDVDGSYLYIVNGLEDTDLDQYSTELRAAYDGGGRLTGVAGLSLFRESTDYRIALDYDPNRVATLVLASSPFYRLPVAANGALNPVLPLGFPARVGEEGLTESDTTSYSVYLDGSYRITDSLGLSAGLRYTFDDKSLATTRPTSNLGLFIPTSTGARRTRSADFDAFQPRVVLDYRIDEDAKVYASVTTGYRSGVIPEAGRTNSDPVTDPEYVISYETGARTTWLDGRLRLNGSLYYYDWTDFQTQVTDPETNLPVSAAAGEASAFGFELEGDFDLTKALRLFGNLNLMQAEYDSFVSGGQDFTGNTMTRSPKVRFTLGAQADIELPAGWTLTANGYASYRSRQYYSDENTALESQDAFTLVNANLVLATPEEGMTVTLYAENLFDVEYLADVGNTGRSFGIPTWVPGHPRVIGVEFGARF
ncbi:TonB-dependent receptor [Rhodocista pekingensis]|uniref:TonB-dependent receptor n=1 Tax=Rhodocista pekingensis TaxID=201185 RepID=A0ABW2KZF7_9PROT